VSGSLRQGRKPGDQRVRVERTRPTAYAIDRPRPIRRPPPPALVLTLGFAALIAVGTLVLMLPISSAAGRWTSPVDALFTATSAVCVTGLVVFDTATYWSGFGQAAILLMVQVGGFGFMTGSTLLLLLLAGRRSGLQNRLLVQASTGVTELGGVGRIVRQAAVFTLVAEVVGAGVLFAAFLARGLDPVTGAVWGIFHAVSAFNNAGFDLMGGFQSLSGFADDPLVLGAIGVLIVLGGIGVAIVGDVVSKRRWRRLALETKVVLLTTAVLIGVGATTVLALEWGNPETLGALPEEQRPFNALFEAVTLRTAGFSSMPTGSLRDATLFVVMALMFIGGASGSTAGGIKVTTFSVLLIAIVSTALGRPSAEAFGRRVPHSIIYRALSVALLSVAFVFMVGFTLELVSGAPFVEVLFEATSAFGTVGASTGLTPQLTDAARLVLIPAMFVGRLGPLTLAVALAARARPVSYRPAVETMRIG
jgi:trk system potassium uptake protein TrkH